MNEMLKFETLAEQNFLFGENPSSCTQTEESSIDFFLIEKFCYNDEHQEFLYNFA